MEIIKMPKVIIEEVELTPAEKYAFLVLASYYSIKNNNAFPPLEKMVKKAGLTEAQYSRALKKIAKKGYITIEKRQGKDFKYNYYIFAPIMDKFIQVPADLLTMVKRKKLTYQNVIVYAQLKEIQYGKVDDFEGMSKSKLAKACCCDRKTLLKNLKQLDAKWIIDYDEISVNNKKTNEFKIQFTYDKNCGLFLPKPSGINTI